MLNHDQNQILPVDYTCNGKLKGLDDPVERSKEYQQLCSEKELGLVVVPENLYFNAGKYFLTIKKRKIKSTEESNEINKNFYFYYNIPGIGQL